jgi:hypothetical protein
MMTTKWAGTARHGGGWRYLSYSYGQWTPVGDCVEHEPHPTEEAAQACYDAWASSRVSLNGWGDWHACKECGEPTQQHAVIAAAEVPLCTDHLTVPVALAHGRVLW